MRKFMAVIIATLLIECAGLYALMLVGGGCKPFCSSTSTTCGGPQTTHSHP